LHIEKIKTVYPAPGFEWSREVGLSFPLNDIMINRMVMEETRWGAVSPGSGWLISTIRADFVSFTSKVVRISPNLLFAAHLAFQAKRAIFLSEIASLPWPGYAGKPFLLQSGRKALSQALNARLSERNPPV
jgi:hypothetical protein